MGFDGGGCMFGMQNVSGARHREQAFLIEGSGHECWFHAACEEMEKEGSIPKNLVLSGRLAVTV